MNNLGGQLQLLDCKTGPVVCIIGQNSLASQYLFNLLSEDPFVMPVLFGDFIDRRESPPHTLLFLLDLTELDVPLSAWINALRLRFINAHYLILLSDTSRNYIYGLLRLGVNGIIRYEDVTTMLSRAVATICDTGTWFPPALSQDLYRVCRTMFRNLAWPDQPLTTRECDTIQLVRRRFSNKEIAARLGVEESTIKYHMVKIFCKLNIDRRDDLFISSTSNSMWKQLQCDGDGTETERTESTARFDLQPSQRGVR